MKKITFLAILSIQVLTSACSSSDNELPSSENNQPNNPPTQINTKPLSITYPYDSDNNLAYYQDKKIYTYDNEKVSKISYGGTIYDVKYIDSNLIELNLLQENVSNANEKEKKSIYLINNNVQYILIDKTTTFSNRIDRSKDSISYSYSNNFPVKIEYYHKTPNLTPYNLSKKIEYTISNGNIITSKTIENQTTEIRNYTYDNNSHVKYGELAYETPLNLGIEYILIHDKTGNENLNNITSVTQTIESTYNSFMYFKTINYTRKIDLNNRLQEISMTGTTFVTSTSTNKNFSDQKIKLEY